MDPNESVKQKLERYQKTLEYVNDVRFAKFSLPESKQHTDPSSSGTTYTAGTRIAGINKDISEGNVASAREVIRTLLEIDPANPLLTELLNKSSISSEEMLEAAESTLSRHALLQDARNNLSLAEARERELAARQPEIKEGEEIVADESDRQVQPQEQEQAQEQQEEQGQPSSGGQGEQPHPRYVIQQRPLTNKERFGTQENYAEHKKANQAMRDEQAAKLWDQRRKSRMTSDEWARYKGENRDERNERAKKLWERRKQAGLVKPGAAKSGWGLDALGAKAGKWLADKLGLTRAAKWLADKTGISNYAKAFADRTGITAANNAINAAKSWLGDVTGYTRASNYLNGLGNSFRNWLGDVTGYTRANSFLNGLANNIGNWAGNLAKDLLRSGVSAARSGLGNLINAVRQYWGAGPSGIVAREALRQAAIRAGLQAGTRLLFTGIILNPLTWVFVVIGITFLLGWLYSSSFNDINCDKPGQMEVKKVLENLHSGDNDIKNGDQIDYQIQVTYIWLCDKINLPSVTITDTVPPSVEYVDGSAKSESPAYGPGPDGVYNEASRTVTWNLTNISSNDPYGVSFSVRPFQQSDGSWSVQDIWLQNAATVTYRAPTSRSSGGFSDITGLLPNPLTQTVANWTDIKSQIIAAFNKHPELIETYKQASAETGLPWQVLAGLHFVETGSGPGPDSSLVSGRKIGQAEPDVSPVKCASGVSGPGIPVPLGGGCGFSNQLDSAIYAANHLAEKIGKLPSTFPEVVEAMSKYNGGGNANCGEGLDYGPCPPQFFGEDDPYAMADFDDAHSHDKMYIIFCADFARCNPPRKFGRPGAIGVVRALIEEGL